MGARYTPTRSGANRALASPPAREYERSVPLLPDHVLHKLRRIRYSIASTGVRRVLMDVATQVATQTLAYSPQRDRSFDREFGTDTGGMVQPTELGIADASLREQAILYLPSPARVTRWMLDNIGIDHAAFSFVDLGCGKGRVLLVASEYPFRKALGVDISAELTEIARRNADLYRPRARRCEDIEVRHGDATLVDFPDGNILLHLYHPFEPAVTAAVLRRLEQSVKAKPRRVEVAYLLYTSAVPPVREVFAQHPWLRQTRYEQSVPGTYDWLFFTNQ
jgi:SAM-dependent methyltransferase